MKKIVKMGFCIVLLSITAVSCNRTSVRSLINKPDNGYIQTLVQPEYEVQVQYQPPSYRTEQELKLNNSDYSREELMNEYDGIQQFLLKYKCTYDNCPDEFYDLAACFELNAAGQYFPCIDAHLLTYSPGAPYHELILLFPLTSRELNDDFELKIKNFPVEGNENALHFNLKKIL